MNRPKQCNQCPNEQGRPSRLPLDDSGPPRSLAIYDKHCTWAWHLARLNKVNVREQVTLNEN